MIYPIFRVTPYLGMCVHVLVASEHKHISQGIESLYKFFFIPMLFVFLASTKINVSPFSTSYVY